MTTQIAVKLPDDLVREVDALVAGGCFPAARPPSAAGCSPCSPRIAVLPSIVPTRRGINRLGSLGSRIHEICTVAGATLDC